MTRFVGSWRGDSGGCRSSPLQTFRWCRMRTAASGGASAASSDSSYRPL